MKATSRVADVLAAQPDVVNFNGVWPDVDLFCTLLENGINVVTTSDWITGHHRNRNHPHPSGKKPTELIEAACQRGGATFYGTGMNPGLAQILSVVATAGMGRVDHVTVLETVDVSCHHSVDTWKNVGYGRPVDDPEVPGLLEKGCTVFGDSIYLMADCLDVEIDDVVFECELGACTEDVDLGWWKLAKGSVGGSLAKFKGIVKGEPKIEVHLEWQMTPKTEPHWKIRGCYITTIQGDPLIINRHMILPGHGHAAQPDERRLLRLARDDDHRAAGAERDALRLRDQAGPARRARTSRCARSRAGSPAPGRLAPKSADLSFRAGPSGGMDRGCPRRIIPRPAEVQRDPDLVRPALAKARSHHNQTRTRHDANDDHSEGAGGRCRRSGFCPTRAVGARCGRQAQHPRHHGR